MVDVSECFIMIVDLKMRVGSMTCKRWIKQMGMGYINYKDWNPPCSIIKIENTFSNIKCYDLKKK